MRRVVVTGIGAVTPLANNFSNAWEATKKGISGIKPIARFNAEHLPWQVAGEIKSFEPSQYLTDKQRRTTDLFVQYAISAACMAFEDAKLVFSQKESDNYGVIIGSSRGGISSIELEIKRLLDKDRKCKIQRISPYIMPSTTIGIASSTVAQKLKLQGICYGVSCACSSGAVAIGEAYRNIKNGYSEVILAGGAEAPICEICVLGYGSAGALSTKKDSSASRPFDKKRDGFVLSEGAVVLVMEELEHAKKRDVMIYGEVTGYSNTTDGFHITKPNLEGEIKTIELAIRDAGISPKAIDLVSAHATSTPLGDLVEAGAIRVVFKEKPDVPVTAIKSITGHMLAASGAFEIACALMSIKDGIIPPTINLSNKDENCQINVVSKLTKTSIDAVLTNSFGFGGINATLIIQKYIT
ncbi:MAG: beta-ketoacyl-[acyl-carrier-protein] synthase family protein [Thermodesulfovibrionales bacterium]|nr:beta-ketoacyl-[acyl-carrier-protein] synthase family protein [Thermodesulfovibrionales bacterium]